MNTPTRVARGLSGLLVLLAATVGLPWALAATVGNPWHAWPGVRAGNMSDQDVLAIMAAVAYLAWASFACALLAESVNSFAARGAIPRRQLQIPLLGVQQDLARALIGAVLLLFSAALAAVGPAAVAHAAPASPPVVASSSSLTLRPAGPATPASPPVQSVPAAASSAAPPVYVIPEQGGLRSYWALAEHYLGDGQRWPEIWQLNEGRTQQDGSVMDTPRQLHSGWRVFLPTTNTAQPAHVIASDHQVEVHPGDTFSGLAASNGISDWQTAWPANAGRAEPGGQRFTDPNLIRPGWTITLPNPPAADPSTSVPRTPNIPAPPPSTAQPQASPSASEPPATNPTEQPTAPKPSPTSVEQSQPLGHSANGASMLETARAVLAGGGVLFAAGLVTAFVTRRRRQVRYRRPGRAMAMPPANLIPTEKALLAEGPAAVADVEFLDRALRELVVLTGAVPPEIVAARLGDGQLQVRIAAARPAGPPQPWSADESGLRWTIEREALTQVGGIPDAGLAPYPTLVTVGHDQAGGSWLLDLESGPLALGGDRDRCADLARFLAAELAVNAWSDQLTVTLVGFGAELAALNPARLRYTDLASAMRQLVEHLSSADDAAAALDVDLLTARRRGVAGDRWMPQVVFVAPPSEPPDAGHRALEKLLTDLRERTGRNPIAIVLVGDQPLSKLAPRRVTIAPDARLVIPNLGVELTAQQLPAEQVDAFAQLLAQVGNLEDVPMPPSTGDTPLDQLIDAAGSPRPDAARPRSPEPQTRSADNIAAPARYSDTPGRSVLPKPDQAYLHGGATTPEDLQRVAPRLDPGRAAAIVAADPDLDNDLADWRNLDSPIPKLTLLGPVALRAHGQQPDKRISYYTEMVAFLATRDHGATAEQLAAAFDVSTSTIYSRINIVRAWLGTHPQTGTKHLPDSTHSSSGQARGVGVYQLGGVAVDANLFKRLAARGKAVGGDEGIRYLQDALSLVTGEPFDQLRPGGYSWLADNPINHYLTHGIVDVAHIVHLHRLQVRDLHRARAAAELALLAAPYEETPRLDLAAVMKAEGHQDAAERYLREEIFNRSDDDAPLDLPERTTEILHREGWLRPPNDPGLVPASPSNAV